LQSSPSVLLLSDHPFRSRDSRERLTTIAFEYLNVMGFLMCQSSALNMYAANMSSGMSVCVGHALSSWNPYFDSSSIDNAAGFMNIAGDKISQQLYELIQKKYPKINLNKSHYETISTLKDKYCFFAQNFLAELQLSKENPNLDVSAELPDGTQITLGPERFLAPEVLFKPSLMGIENLGLHDQIADSILACPVDVRAHLAQHIIVDSPFTKNCGFISRLKASIEEDCYPNSNLFRKVNILDTSDGVWKGGKKFTTEIPDSFWISKKEYVSVGSQLLTLQDEGGPGIVHKRV